MDKSGRINIITDLIRTQLINDLPGIESQLKLVPKLAGRSFRNFAPTDNAKLSAVLILLKSGNDDFEILFTLRSSKLKSHSGQISFPGGRVENEETPVQAALRETMEEVGIQPDMITIIGGLSDLFVPPSNNLIKPFIGILNSEPMIKLSENEVDEAFWVPIKKLCNPETIKHADQLLDGKLVSIPYFDVHHGTKLWGATSMILSEFIDIYKNTGLYAINQ